MIRIPRLGEDISSIAVSKDRVSEFIEANEFIREIFFDIDKPRRIKDVLRVLESRKDNVALLPTNDREAAAYGSHLPFYIGLTRTIPHNPFSGRVSVSVSGYLGLPYLPVEFMAVKGMTSNSLLTELDVEVLNDPVTYAILTQSGNGLVFSSYGFAPAPEGLEKQERTYREGNESNRKIIKHHIWNNKATVFEESIRELLVPSGILDDPCQTHQVTRPGTPLENSLSRYLYLYNLKDKTA